MQALFHEELGLVLEVAGKDVAAVHSAYQAAGVSCVSIGKPCAMNKVTIVGKSGVAEFEGKMTSLRDTWESSSFALEMMQTNPKCVAQEKASMSQRRTPLIYAAIPNPKPVWTLPESAPKVAIVREEGSNGDREMGAAFRLAGFQPWDVTMSDLAKGSITLDRFRGVAFVGGFSYADTLGSAKGWAATAKFHPTVAAELKKFYERADTFSLGVCNGCQLEHRLNWVPFGPGGVPEDDAPRLTHNESARFESRWINLRIESSKCMWFKGMEGSVLGMWSAHGEGKFEFPGRSSWANARRRVLLPCATSMTMAARPRRIPSTRMDRPRVSRA